MNEGSEQEDAFLAQLEERSHHISAFGRLVHGKMCVTLAEWQEQTLSLKGEGGGHDVFFHTGDLHFADAEIR